MLTFEALVRLVARAIGGRARIVHAPPAVTLALAAATGVVLRDALLTRVELDAVTANMLATSTVGSGPALAGWLAQDAGALGRRFVSERRLNWR